MKICNVNRVLVCLFALAVLACGKESKKNPTQPPNDPPPTLPLAEAEEGNQAIQRFVGYVELGKQLGERLALDPAKFYLNSFLLGYGSSGIDDLVALMGIWEGKGQDARFRNGSPSSVNTLLYELVIIGLSKDLVRVCQENPPYSTVSTKYQPRILSTVQELCDSEANQDSSKTSDLYLALNGFRAPREEMIAWQEFFSEEYVSEKPTDKVRDMIYAALFNPYVLLRN